MDTAASSAKRDAHEAQEAQGALPVGERDLLTGIDKFGGSGRRKIVALRRPPAQKGLLICGVDEAGRGPLAGPVYAAAVVLNPKKTIRGLDDSKKLSAKERERLSIRIQTDALAFGIASASVEEIDHINILNATLLAMRRAVEKLLIAPDAVWVDGLYVPTFDNYMDSSARAIIKGDAQVAAISAASILAKSARDRELLLLAKQYPDYGFERHKGYATKLHLERIKQHGASPAHRRSFAPVKHILGALL